MKKRIIRVVFLAVVVAAVIFGVRWQKSREKANIDGDLALGLRLWGRATVTCC